MEETSLIQKAESIERRDLNSITEGEIIFESWRRVAEERPFVQVHPDIETDNLVGYIREKWKLKTPSLIVSVTGGAVDFAMNRKYREKLRSAVRRVASTEGGCWFITGGSNVGIMKIVGEAVGKARSSLRGTSGENKGKESKESKETSKDNIHAIGIATWGAIKPERESETGRNLYSARKLDSNHTHFILCDDSSKDEFGHEQELRGRFEKAIVDGDKVPIVCVLMDGGSGSIDTVRNALINGTPSVIIDGSGRAADVMSWAIKNMTSLNRGELEEELNNRLRRIHIPGKNIEEDAKRVLECLQHRQRMCVYEIDEDSGQVELDNAILKTFEEVGEFDLKKLIELSVEWDRPEITKKILKDNWKSGVLEEKCTKETIEKSVDKCLIANKTRFIKLFLDYLDLRPYLTRDRLENVYSATREDMTVFFLLEDNITKRLVKRKYTLDIIHSELDQLGIHYTPDYDSDENTNFKCPERELFVYSLLFARTECADIFWIDVTSKIAASLFAAQVCRAIIRSPSTRLDNSLLSTARNAISSYREKADAILNQCYQCDYQKTKFLLGVRSWGNKNCYDLAIVSDSKNFFATTGCQKIITERWYGRIDGAMPFWRVFACAMFPLLVLGLRFRKSSIDEVAQVKQELEQDRPSKRNAFDSNFNAGRTADDEAGEDINKYRFFYEAPVVKFILNFIAHLVFITVFTYMNIKGLSIDSPRIEEYVVIFWAFTLLLEELRQFMSSQADWSHHGLMGRAKFFLVSYWNLLDAAAIALLIPGVILRFISTGLVRWAHVLYVLALIIYCIRITSYMSMYRKLGPTVVMISKMLKDLLYFMSIFLVYVLAYGIAVHSLVYSNANDSALSLFWGIFIQPFYETFGEPWMEATGATDKCTDDANAVWPYRNCPDQSNTIFALMLKCIYIVFTNVLLFNLLIAIFNYRYTKVNEESDVYWKYQIFKLVKEYEDRPKLPPPLIILSHAASIYEAVCSQNQRNRIGPAENLTETAVQNAYTTTLLEEWERDSAEEFITREESRWKFNSGREKSRIQRMEEMLEMLLVNTKPKFDEDEMSMDETA